MVPLKKTTLRFWFLSAGILFLAIVIDLSVNILMTNRAHNNQQVAVTLELGSVRARLEERLNTNLYLISGMAAFISVRPEFSGQEFDRLARELLTRSSSLKNIAAAPDFIIRHVCPEKGNEAILGINYRDLPAQWEKALQVKTSGQMVVAGPFDLIQGGQGLVARIPVFTGENRAFWGLVSSVIDAEELLDMMSAMSEKSRLAIAIRGKDGRGPNGEIFWGDPDLFNRKAEAVFMPVSLPSGSWQMAAVPVMGWVKASPHRWSVHLAVLLITAVMIFSVYNWNRSSQAIIETQNRLKAMSDASHDAIVMIASDDTITFWNPAAEAMFGYSEKEIMGRKLHDIVSLPHELKQIHKGLEQFGKSGHGPVVNTTMEMDAVHRSGRIFPVERAVAAFQLQGKWFAVGSLRDITTRKAFEKQLTELATTDSLTGLFNRHHFSEQAERQLLQAVRYEKPFSLMMFDLDHFKKINDTYGHPAGDSVLQCVAATVRRELRASDISGRIGGEEFAVAMPETDLDTAVHAAERIRKAIMNAGVVDQGRSISFTVSIGLTSLVSKEPSLSKLMKLADNNLYEAKHSGRNRVVAG